MTPAASYRRQEGPTSPGVGPSAHLEIVMRPERTSCTQCEKEFGVAGDGPIPKYCSASCRRFASYLRSRQDGRYDALLAAERSARAEQRRRNARPCPYCSTPMTHPRRVQCGGDACKRRYYADRQRERSRAIKQATGEWPHRRYAQQQREYDRQRRVDLGNARKRYPAAAAAGDARRRMRMQQARTAEVFAPQDVHSRDEWTCQLCRLPIDPKVAWPDPMSASVDHIIPLSRGGEHSMINVQSAHLSCNSSKGDRVDHGPPAGEPRRAAPVDQGSDLGICP